MDLLMEEMEEWVFLEVEEYREWICRDDAKWDRLSKEGKVG